MYYFKDRTDAGKKVAQILLEYRDKPNTIVIGLPRGGVVTAFEVAQLLHLPLDIVVPRKIGAPFNPELALGALTPEGTIVWNDELVKKLSLESPAVQEIIADEKKEALRRLKTYRAGRPAIDFTNKTVIVVDDGIATGATMRAAIAQIRKKGAQKIVVAVPVAAIDSLEKLEKEVDAVVSVTIPKTMWGIGSFYKQFEQTDDQMVVDLLNKARVQ